MATVYALFFCYTAASGPALSGRCYPMEGPRYAAIADCRVDQKRFSEAHATQPKAPVYVCMKASVPAWSPAR